MPETCEDVIDRALVAYSRLAELGETIDDEWSYVNDLADAWRDRLAEVAEANGSQPATPETSLAVDRAIEEIDRIADAHRAIDWLSTFPQVVLLACHVLP